MPSKRVEEVEGCNWFRPCEICDSYFGEWVKLDDVVRNDRMPEDIGIYMYAVHYGKNRDVVDTWYYSGETGRYGIMESLKDSHMRMYSVLREEKFVGKNPFLEMRWKKIKNPYSDDSLFLYAHWLNADGCPINGMVPGQGPLNRASSFVLRTRDNKWCYETLGPTRTTKFKQKKQLAKDLDHDVRH
ncbi:uncharacterized protein CEXT_125391 [Caerostris extrusa]|uniref:Uncharacterized protein n=1 Tax=Caerostris extrusa TaxID=172846 RepID=A0AAV4MXL3_CAEEX|nr:uncharacterized protein CEXT_125391 [Caerostris extrusa]